MLVRSWGWGLCSELPPDASALWRVSLQSQPGCLDKYIYLLSVKTNAGHCILYTYRNGQKAERKTSRETWLLRGREVAAAIDRPSGALGLGEATITPGPTFTEQTIGSKR